MDARKDIIWSSYFQSAAKLAIDNKVDVSEHVYKKYKNISESNSESKKIDMQHNDSKTKDESKKRILITTSHGVPINDDMNDISDIRMMKDSLDPRHVKLSFEGRSDEECRAYKKHYIEKCRAQGLIK
jgi:hypothetical protein